MNVCHAGKPDWLARATLRPTGTCEPWPSGGVASRDRSVGTLIRGQGVDRCQGGGRVGGAGEHRAGGHQSRITGEGRLAEGARVRGRAVALVVTHAAAGRVVRGSAPAGGTGRTGAAAVSAAATDRRRHDHQTGHQVRTTLCHHITLLPNWVRRGDRKGAADGPTTGWEMPVDSRLGSPLGAGRRISEGGRVLVEQLEKKSAEIAVFREVSSFPAGAEA